MTDNPPIDLSKLSNRQMAAIVTAHRDGELFHRNLLNLLLAKLEVGEVPPLNVIAETKQAIEAMDINIQRQIAEALSESKTKLN